MRDAFVNHARFCAPDEACGLVAMDAGHRPRMVYCCTNVDRSPRRFTVSPQEHFAAIRHAEAHGWTIGGAFHSHPSSPPRPSPTDVAGALDPTWVHFIVGPLRVPEVRAFRIVDGVVDELAIDVVDDTAT